MIPTYLTLPQSPCPDLLLCFAFQKHSNPERWGGEMDLCSNSASNMQLTVDCCSAAAPAASLPAGHHQPGQTFEKPHVSFFLQVVQHFLQQSKSSEVQTKAVTSTKAARSEMHLLDQDVPPVQDRNA